MNRLVVLGGLPGTGKTTLARKVSRQALLPTWDEVAGRYYVPWSEPHWIIDTAFMSAEEAVTAIGARMTQ